jgi:hypothetical protein
MLQGDFRHHETPISEMHEIEWLSREASVPDEFARKTTLSFMLSAQNTEPKRSEIIRGERCGFQD